MSIQNNVFLSHIHEEKDMAILLQNAIEEEFSGFVDVFVSSDGKSILAGTNFIKRIEKMLLSSSAAIFLISPRSVKRNWINFELGAIWIRGVHEGGIPAIPLCHSGITPKDLPPPLNSLDAIQANDTSQLERAFHAIQKAVGAKGKLRTDFKALAEKLGKIEDKNILCSHLVRVLAIFAGNRISQLIPEWEKLTKESIIELKKSGIDNRTVGELVVLQESFLKSYLEFELTNIHKVSDTDGNTSNADVCIKLPVDLLLSHKDELCRYNL